MRRQHQPTCYISENIEQTSMKFVVGGSVLKIVQKVGT